MCYAAVCFEMYGQPCLYVMGGDALPKLSVHLLACPEICPEIRQSAPISMPNSAEIGASCRISGQATTHNKSEFLWGTLGAFSRITFSDEELFKLVRLDIPSNNFSHGTKNPYIYPSKYLIFVTIP